MASVVFSLVDSKNGINTVVYEISDSDIERIYKVYKHLYRPALDDHGNETSRRLTAKELVDRISWGIVERLFNTVKDMEIQMVVENMKINNIEILEVK